MLSNLPSLKTANSISFNKRKTNLVNVFTKAKEGLLALVTDQQLYRDKLIDEQVKIQHEIDVTEASIDESKRTITNIENILK